MIDVLAAVSFCVAFFTGGYFLGRLAQPAAGRFEVDPDPLREPEGAEEAEVIPLEAARSRRSRERASARRLGAAAS